MKDLEATVERVQTLLHELDYGSAVLVFADGSIETRGPRHALEPLTREEVRIEHPVERFIVGDPDIPSQEIAERIRSGVADLT